MDLFDNSGVLVVSVLLIVGAAIGWQAEHRAIPAPTTIEALATSAGSGNGNGNGSAGHLVAERRLRDWAALGSPVAQRELALRYLSDPLKRQQAIDLFDRAAMGGDARAAGLRGLVRGAELPLPP